MGKIIYQLTVEDIQTVASQEIGRVLTKDEIKYIKDAIADRIDWYNVIANTINENLKNQ